MHVAASSSNPEGICFLRAGTFAVYSLIARFAHISPGNTQSPDDTDLQISRYSTSHGLRKTSRAGAACRHFFNSNRLGQLLLLILALTGTSLVLGDSVLTPAQSGDAVSSRILP